MHQLTARQFLESALREDPYYIAFADREDALKFRLACYQVRSRQRKINEQAYIDEVDYTPFTEWDGLVLSVKELDGAWLLLSKQRDLYMEHTAHGQLTPEQLQRLEDGTLRMDELSVPQLDMDEASSSMDQVSPGMDSPSDIQDG
jgi:hypothetical protein